MVGPPTCFVHLQACHAAPSERQVGTLVTADDIVSLLLRLLCCAGLCCVVQEPACELSDMQRSVVARVVHQAASRAQLATYGLESLC